MEFFCSPAKLKSLLEELSHHPNLSYHALNAKGEEYTNNTAAGQGKCNAVTWGVFPGREIVQPTVVDAAAFGIWKVGEIGSDRLSVSDLKQPNPTRTHHTCCPTTATIPPRQDEAFELWLTQWATAYEEGSAARKVIQDIHDTFFLVNIVDNDFTGQQSAAAPDSETPAAAQEAGAFGSDIFAVFRKVILRDMSADQLAAYTTETERENHQLHGVVEELRRANTAMTHEMKLLRETLAVNQREVDALKAQVSAFKLQRGFAGLGGNGGALASARGAGAGVAGVPKPATSAATPAATPAAAFFPTA